MIVKRIEGEFPLSRPKEQKNCLWRKGLSRRRFGAGGGGWGPGVRRLERFEGLGGCGLGAAAWGAAAGGDTVRRNTTSRPLDASLHLYMRSYPSVGRSVCWSVTCFFSNAENEQFSQ